MRKTLLAALALTAMLAPVAGADEMVQTRAAAIDLCRHEVSAQTGIAADQIRLDQARARLSTVRVDLDVWVNGALQNVRCDVSHHAGALQVASITPALTATASATPASASTGN